MSEEAARQAAIAEWAEEALELETDHASATLRAILALTPPSPRYAPYYEAYLRRCLCVFACEAQHQRIDVCSAMGFNAQIFGHTDEMIAFAQMLCSL